jgi:hypothetical protein
MSKKDLTIEPESCGACNPDTCTCDYVLKYKGEILARFYRREPLERLVKLIKVIN